MCTPGNQALSTLQERLVGIATEGVANIYSQLLQATNPIYVIWVQYPTWEIGSHLVEIIEGDFEAVLRRWQAYYDHLVAMKLHLNNHLPTLTINIAHPSQVSPSTYKYAVILQKIEGGYDGAPEEEFNFILGALLQGLDAVEQAKLCKEIICLRSEKSDRLVPTLTAEPLLGKLGNCPEVPSLA